MNKDSWNRYSKEGGSAHVQALVPGFKFNMTDLNAALALAQLRRADDLLATRNRLFEYYGKILARFDWLDRPVFKTAEGRWGNHVYVIKVKDPDLDRDALMKVLREYNIGTNIHFYPVHLNQFYSEKYPQVRLPVADRLAGQLMTLPLCTRYSEADLDYVADALDDIYRSGRAHRATGS